MEHLPPLQSSIPGVWSSLQGCGHADPCLLQVAFSGEKVKTPVTV